MFTRISVLSLFTILHFVAYSQKTEDVKEKKQVDDHSALFAHSWNLVELNGVSTMQPGMKQAFITFQEGDYNYNRISGFTGCNYIRGSVHLQGDDNITFHPDLLTNYNCAGNSVESPLLQTMITADSWSEKNGQLILERKGKIVARWNASTYSNANLTGSWELIYVNELSAPFAQVFPATRCPKITFTQNQNTISGFSGCHEFTSSFVINTDALVFKGSTPCDSTCKTREKNVFLGKLNKVNGYVFKDEKTLVFIEDDKPVMAFTRMKPIQASPPTASRE